MRPTILLWSARYDLENGQAIVTRRVAERQKGVEWLRAVYEPGGGISSIKACLSIIRALFLVVLHRPQAVYVVCSRSSVGFLRDAPLLALGYLGARVIVHVHGSDLPDLLVRRTVGGLARLLYRRCEIVVPSTHMTATLQDLSCRSVTVCENFMEEAESPCVAPSYSGGDVTLLWNSNLMASKGVKEAIEGARLARARGVDVRVTVLGRPLTDEEADIAEMTAFQAGIAHEHQWIDVIGPVSSQEARELVRSHDAVMLPSRYGSECQPLALIEAMAAARDVIVRDTPALRATIGGYPAHIVEGDVLSICESIEQLGTQGLLHSQRLCQAATEARGRFSPIRFDTHMHAILTDTRRRRQKYA